MRITLAELRSLDTVTIDLLEIVSIEGQRYMARIHIGDALYLLSDEAGKTALFRSSWEIQDTLGAFEVTATDMVHPSAYHEMVGMAPSDVEPMRIRIQGDPS
ncbi:MAG: DUF6482 family protein [Marinobacter sp.]|uniref:DUF6482 family protein n=1 Tax=Marinobacter sp. TaxID=50741 RepID=UPI00299E47B3|nr:DUF6482 family protein [Marinobacter sp.]MDX1633653.1 DUF6482 family protein [Marinobacter sp.]